jgi:hypothetical protein
MSRRKDLDTFYKHLRQLRDRVGGFRLLSNCTGKTGWPTRGLYFFFEDGEFRNDGETLRVVRVGTHAVSNGSRTKLWHRLHTHQGRAGERGNHRGSIFRKRVGEALLSIGEYPDHMHSTWGAGSSASKPVVVAEEPLEIEVSRYIGQMPMLWLDVGDEPSKDSHRAFLERNSIALLSNLNKPPVDPPSGQWLGLKTTQSTIRNSGLWNTNHVDGVYDAIFIGMFRDYISRM